MAYLFGDSWFWQTAYKVLALVMLVVGGMQAYTVVWDLGDVGIGLMTIFNMLALYPLSGEALTALREYEAKETQVNKSHRPRQPMAVVLCAVTQPHFEVVVAEAYQLRQVPSSASAQMGGRGIPLKVLFLQVV